MFSTCTPHHILTPKQKKEIHLKSSDPLAQRFHNIKTAPTQKRQERKKRQLKGGWDRVEVTEEQTSKTRYCDSSVLYLTLVSLAHDLSDVRCDPHDLVRSDSGETALSNTRRTMDLCTFICSKQRHTSHRDSKHLLRLWREGLASVREVWGTHSQATVVIFLTSIIKCFRPPSGGSIRTNICHIIVIALAAQIYICFFIEMWIFWEWHIFCVVAFHSFQQGP